MFFYMYQFFIAFKKGLLGERKRIQFGVKKTNVPSQFCHYLCPLAMLHPLSKQQFVDFKMEIIILTSQAFVRVGKQIYLKILLRRIQI